MAASTQSILDAAPDDFHASMPSPPIPYPTTFLSRSTAKFAQYFISRSSVVSTSVAVKYEFENSLSYHPLRDTCSTSRQMDGITVC
ncbi:hypothetical protein DL95DRAFT_398012 [Leptodontidium sp. 2 PMI_412]|nr:hypothetical protein DL95DRAFT_398012 [Leptodontidium sp. 2 PMI_412]